MNKAQRMARVAEAIGYSSTRVTRRLEIYESDGVTRWDDGNLRLIEGSVTVDYSRTERRAIDLLLDNRDGGLAHDPYGGFWYDKIFKPYRGLEFSVPRVPPTIALARDIDSRFGPELVARGYTDVTPVAPATAATAGAMLAYDVVVAYSGGVALTTELAIILEGLYDEGHSILTIGSQDSAVTLPFVESTRVKGAGLAWQFHHPPRDSPLSEGWVGQPALAYDATGLVISELTGAAQPGALMWLAGQPVYPAVFASNPEGGRWVHLSVTDGWSTGQGAVRTFISNAIEWLYDFKVEESYEVQVGEFMIDNIAEENHPTTVRVTGRDYMKKLQLFKLGRPVTFREGIDLSQVISGLSAQAGVFRTKLDTRNRTLATDVSYEKGTEVHKIIREVAETHQLEIFFDHIGVMVARPFLDPLTSPTSLRIETGAAGNLVTYSKSSNDASIFNIVQVTSENSGTASAGALVYGEASNTEPSSPTRVERLGPRVYPYSSALVTSDLQAEEMAQMWLKVMALEQFQLNFSILVYPFLEAGEIIEFVDPRPGAGEPDRLLLTSFDVPLTLAPMSGMAKRVLIVGPGSERIVADRLASVGAPSNVPAEGEDTSGATPIVNPTVGEG